MRECACVTPTPVAFVPTLWEMVRTLGRVTHTNGCYYHHYSRQKGRTFKDLYVLLFSALRNIILFFFFLFFLLYSFLYFFFSYSFVSHFFAHIFRIFYCKKFFPKKNKIKMENFQINHKSLHFCHSYEILYFSVWNSIKQKTKKNCPKKTTVVLMLNEWMN